jgi:hypothetical protein
VIDLSVVETYLLQRITAADYPEFAVDDRATRETGADQHGCSAGPRIGCDVVDVEAGPHVASGGAASHVDFVIDHATRHFELSLR